MLLEFTSTRFSSVSMWERGPELPSRTVYTHWEGVGFERGGRAVYCLGTARRPLRAAMTLMATCSHEIAAPPHILNAYVRARCDREIETEVVTVVCCLAMEHGSLGSACARLGPAAPASYQLALSVHSCTHDIMFSWAAVPRQCRRYMRAEACAVGCFLQRRTKVDRPALRPT